MLSFLDIMFHKSPLIGSGVLLLILICSCKKMEEGYNIIGILNPPVGSVVTYHPGDSILMTILCTGDAKIKYVDISLGFDSDSDFKPDDIFFFETFYPGTFNTLIDFKWKIPNEFVPKPESTLMEVYVKRDGGKSGSDSFNLNIQ